MKKKILIGSIIAVALLTLVSFSSAVGFQSVKNNLSNTNITDEWDFKYCKNYLFETLIEIYNNEDVKDLINSNNNNPFSINYNNRISLSVEKLDFLYNMGIKLVDRLGKKKALEILSNANPEFNEQLDTIIMGDEELSKRVNTLYEMNSEEVSIAGWGDTPIICFLLFVLLVTMVIFLYIPANFIFKEFHITPDMLIGKIIHLILLPFDIIFFSSGLLFLEFDCYPYPYPKE